MKNIPYQQNAVNELTDKTIRLLNLGGKRHKIVFEAPTGAGKTVMTCQALANITDELKERGDSRYQEVAYIWFAPRKLHLQSYASLKNAFGETRKLRPVMFDEIDQSEGIQPGEILFVNWESVNKESNVMVRENESFASLYEITRRTQEEYDLPIVAIIDEEHMFWSKTADKSAAVLERVNPTVELRISATPKTLHPDEKVKVYRQDVIAAEMIKKEVVLNLDIELDFSEERTLNENLIKAALAKRNQLAELYQELGVKINPLLLIQLPNDVKETMTLEDQAIAEQVKTYLEAVCGITAENGLLAVWLANEKENLAGLERPDNMTQVLLFKEAIALGWDCPRAAVLLIFRKLQSDQFTIQTVGRILRMPEQKHYPKEQLNIGYVYTDIAKDKIRIVTADSDYILKNTITACRRENLENVSLPAYYSERPNVERNYLGPDFKKTLYEVADEFWKLERGAGLFSIAELAALRNDNDEFTPLPESDDDLVNENRRRVKNSIRLDVKTVNVEIPKDVHFQNEEQVVSHIVAIQNSTNKEDPFGYLDEAEVTALSNLVKRTGSNQFIALDRQRQELEIQLSTLDNLRSQKQTLEQTQAGGNEYLIQNYEAAQKQIEKLKGQEATLKADIQRLEKRIHQFDVQIQQEPDIKFDTLVKLKPLFEKIADSLLKKKKAQIESEMQQQLNKLLVSYKGHVAKVELSESIEQFNIKLYHTAGNEISLNQLNAASKQIFIQVLLKVLRNLGDYNPPVMIDTVMGVLDNESRDALMEEYFPQLAEQTILLCTTSEIRTDSDYIKLEPFISKTYTLHRNVEAQNTTVEEGYFGLTLNQ